MGDHDPKLSDQVLAAAPHTAPDLEQRAEVLIDLQSFHRQQLEDEQLRVLASAVGDHALPPDSSWTRLSG